MFGKLLGRAGRRHETRPRFALCTLTIATAILSAAPAVAQSPPYFHDGLRWVGRAKACTAPRSWSAVPVFRTPGLFAALGDLCLYGWTAPGQPSSSDVLALFTTSGAQEMTEDVPVLFPNSPLASAEAGLYAGLRAALRAQVGDASLLPSMPVRPQVRIVVIDSAPDAPHGDVHPGTSRHGDTLAHLIEDIVCRPSDDPAGRACAAEVTTVLALPWLSRGVLGANGGYIGTLADLAHAIERAVSRWQNDRRIAPSSTPPRLILNLSLGWEHTAGIADCPADLSRDMGPPARAVRTILQYAASQGALIIAAAGNDSGGETPRTGLVCPGRYQALPRDSDPSQALLVAVSGVDYQDQPLETARPLGITGIAALGLGGVAWDPSDPVPPQLTGSSVSTAVVSAISALVWAQRPHWAAGQVTQAVYDGGSDVGPADQCPLLLGHCRSRRASVCGALTSAGTPLPCSPAAPRPWSCPDLPAEMAALDAAFAHVSPSTGTPVPLNTIPRYLSPSVQIEPSTFPTPVSVTCRACALLMGVTVTQPYLALPERGQLLISPVLVVEFPSGAMEAMELGPQLDSTTSYVFPVPPGWIVRSAYLTGFEPSGHSITEQVFVQQ